MSGSTTLNIENELLSATVFDHASEFRDARHVNLGFFSLMEAKLGKGKPTKKGGARWIQPVLTGEHSKTTKLVSGYEEINLDVSGVLDPMVFKPASCVRPVLISGEEEELNGAGETGIIDIAAARTTAAMGAMYREGNEHFVRGGVAEWDQWNTLNGVDYSGFLEEDPVGAQTNSVGGLSRSALADVVGLQNLRGDVAGDFSANGLSVMHRVDIATQLYSDGGENHGWLASRRGLENYKNSLQVLERYVDTKKLDGAGNIRSLEYNGAPLMPEAYMANAGSVTASTPVSFMRIDFDNIHVCWSDGKRNGHFGMDTWKDHSGSFDVKFTKIHARGQLVSRGKMNSSAIITDGDTY